MYDFYIQLAKNGTLLAGAYSREYLQTLQGGGSYTVNLRSEQIQFLYDNSAGSSTDYFSVYIYNSNGTYTLTINEATLDIDRLP